MKKTCIGPGLTSGKLCGKTIHGRDLCSAHLRQVNRGEELKPLPVKVARGCSYVAPDGIKCTGKHSAKGLCAPHYKQIWRNEELRPLEAERPAEDRVVRQCSVTFDDGTPCKRKHKAHGLCGLHVKRKEAGTPLGRPLLPRGVQANPPPKQTAPPLEPWNPNELKHVGRGISKPPGGAGSGPTLASFGPRVRIDPGLHWNAWRAAIQMNPDAEIEALAVYAGALGVTDEVRKAAA